MSDQLNQRHGHARKAGIVALSIAVVAALMVMVVMWRGGDQPHAQLTPEVVSSSLASPSGTASSADGSAPTTQSAGSAPLEASLGPLQTVATFTPSPATRDVGNPGRGQYLWFPYDHPQGVPAGTSATDSYVRFTWKQVEPTRGRYNFASIDSELTRAKARRGTFSFRIMAVCQNCGENILPDDVNALPTTWSVNAEGRKLRVPDWNDPAFLARWESLMQALGARYRNDPRLGMVDVGGYGNWGEGHNWPYEKSYPGPRGQAEASAESATRMALAVIGAFPNTFISFNPVNIRAGGHTDHAASWRVYKAALTASPKVGLRNDCLGGGSVQQSAVDAFNAMQRLAITEGLPVNNRPLDRWRIAPFISEWCNNIAPGSTDGSFAQGAGQVKQWHVAQVGNGNFKAGIGNYSPSEQAAFTQSVRSAGYTLGVRSATVSVPTGSSKPTAVAVRASWVNTGVAPPYRPWRVVYALRDSAGVVKARATSRLNVRSLLGNGSSVADSVVLMASTPLTGSYTLQVRVEDESRYFPPMRLPGAPRSSDGSYRLGVFRLG